MSFITNKQKNINKKDWWCNKTYMNHSRSPWSENGTQAFTFTIKSDRHMACVCTKGPRPCVQWSERKQYSLLASNKPGDMRKGLRTDRDHVKLALWTGFSSEILMSWHVPYVQEQQFNWIIAVLFSKRLLDLKKKEKKKRALIKHKWHETVILRSILWHCERS